MLNFGGNTNDKINQIRLILDQVDADILLVQEIEGSEAYSLFLDSVVGRLAQPLTGPGFLPSSKEQDSYSAIFLDTSMFTLRRTDVVETVQRAAIAQRLEHKNSGDTIIVFTAHWKAGEASNDEDIRFNEGSSIQSFIQFLRTVQRETTNYLLVGGDFNVYSSFDRGYIRLTDGGGISFYDPLARSGEWHDNETFADIHTQSTRARQFGGGVAGGMDDRFDQILLTDVLLLNRYVPGSYMTFGNDGQHFNDSINAFPNLAVSLEMAQALHDASDHLPVYLDLIFPKSSSSVEESEKERIRRLNLK